MAKSVLLVSVAASSLWLATHAWGDETSIDAFVEAAQGVQIIVLGEVHDNPEHHRNQAEIVRALGPAALVFEMIPQRLEGEVNKLRADGADRDTIAEALEWDDSGWPDFDYYAEILEAAPDARIFGAGQASEDVAKAAEAGAAAAFGPDARVYGLNVPLEPDELEARQELMAEAHCNALPESALPGMVEVRRFRDAGLADAALWARTSAGELGQVVVIAGSGHADNERGLPALLQIAQPKVSVLTLGQVESPSGADKAFDMYMVAPAPDRDDPCAIFETETQ